MPESEFNAQFFEEFLDDYFAESDEHLLAIKRHLLSFEDALDQGRASERNVLNDLFRNFHSIKGISAMAGVSAAESLAHNMESYLRLLRDEQAQLTAEGLEILIESTKKLEQVIEARRLDKELPAIDTELRMLESLTSGAGTGEKPRSKAPTGAGASSTPLYIFEFSPSPELAERDINVNVVKERLGTVGVIRKSVPAVRDGGRIAFEFTVETGADESAFAGWENDGLSFKRIEPPAPKDSAATDNALEDSPRLTHFGQSNIVRVDLARLDELMLMIGELVISRSRLTEQIKQIENLLPAGHWRDLQQINHSVERQLRNLRDGVMRVRMIPIGEVFERMQFAVRDLVKETGKQIRLNFSGENTEIDKLLVERMLDPLLHLVRNAVSHGIEDTKKRTAQGKPAEGTISLEAKTVGETVVIEIKDDGRGIVREKIMKQARARNLLAPNEIPDDEKLLEILCSPGFSTRETADKTSGRGVGMDVVRRTVDELGGALEMQTAPGQGTTFCVRLPLTLAIADSLIVAVDRERFAVPQSSVREIIEIEPRTVRIFENNEVIEHRGTPLPIIRLARLFGLSEKYRRVFYAFVVGEGKQAVGVAVDRVLGQSEIVIRKISDPLARVPGISGATELGDGRVVLILDVPAITRRLKQKL